MIYFSFLGVRIPQRKISADCRKASDIYASYQTYANADCTKPDTVFTSAKSKFFPHPVQNEIKACENG